MADEKATKKDVIASLLASIWGATQTNRTISVCLLKSNHCLVWKPQSRKHCQANQLDFPTKRNVLPIIVITRRVIFRGESISELLMDD